MLRILALAAVLLSSVACLDDSLEDSGSIASLEPSGEGNLSLEWAIFMGDEMHDCIDAGADSVELTLTGDRGEQTRVMACLSGLAETDAVGAGDYDAAIRLVDYEGNTLDQLELGTLTIQANRTTPIGAVDFVVVRDPIRRDNRQ
ncbi:MAG: hypothetical protein KJO07_25465 [Deltaproteobacteria bacterium]|nr:hypothetical protein [Deltaproteobacteria bacterium]